MLKLSLVAALLAVSMRASQSFAQESVTGEPPRWMARLSGTILNKSNPKRMNFVEVGLEETEHRTFAQIQIGDMHFEAPLVLDPSSTGERKVLNIVREHSSYGNSFAPVEGKFFVYQLITEKKSDGSQHYALLCKDTAADVMESCETGTVITLGLSSYPDFLKPNEL